MNSYNSILSIQSQPTVLFQKILLILSISIGLNFLPNVIFPYYDVAPMAGVAFFLIIFLMYRGLRDVIITSILFWRANLNFRIIFIPIIFLFVFELIRFPVNPGVSIYVFLILPILLFSFILFLIDIYINFCNGDINIFISNYVKTYFKLSSIIVLISGIVFFLLKIGAIDMFQWTDVSLYGSDFAIRVDSGDGGNPFVNPYYLTVISPYFIKASTFFGEFGTFLGWSYEPHVACFFLTPAFLMINYFEKRRFRKYLLVSAYILFYILSLSLTAIIGLFIVLFIYLFIAKNRNVKQRSLLIISMIVLILLIPTIYSKFYEEINYSQQKLESQSTKSSSYGITFEYLLSPSSFFGNGLLTAPMAGDISFATEKESTSNEIDIGIIPFINFFWFYCLIVLASLKVVFNKKQFNFIGLILIYLIFHSMKFPFHVFHYPFVFFFYFLLSIIPKSENL